MRRRQRCRYFPQPGFTKDSGELCVLGFGRARSLRTYDWTYQYADHETWFSPPLSLSWSLSVSFFVPWNLHLPVSLFDKHRVPPLSSHPLRRYLSLLFLLPFLPRFLPRTPSPSAREAKRRLFRRECFRRNAETVLIAAHLA